MDYDYSPFNPLIWGLFAAFCIFVYLIVKIFHRKYPNYPQPKRMKGHENKRDKANM